MGINNDVMPPKRSPTIIITRRPVLSEIEPMNGLNITNIKVKIAGITPIIHTSKLRESTYKITYASTIPYAKYWLAWTILVAKMTLLLNISLNPFKNFQINIHFIQNVQ